MSKFSKKLISSVVPAANTAGIYNAAEQLQNLTALAITAVNFCADSSGNANGLNDDTAINTAGGFVKLTGSGFTSATIVYINGISVTKYYLNNTTIVAVVPAATAGTTASLMVFNGSTVGSIWAAGISYSGFPSWTTTAATNLGVVVSTQLVAVGDAPLVYTFVSGTLPPNCTISSSGLLSGTVTGVSTNTIYTFTVAVTDAQNQNVSQSIVYTLVVSDAFYRYTSLHISGDSNPTWITDASTNALAVTSTGAPQSTIFSPLKAGYYGNSFNGSSDYLTTPKTSAMDFGAGDFTVECWIYKSGSSSAGYDTIIQTGTGGSGYYGFTMEASSTRGFAWYTQPGAFILLNYNVSSDDSRWHHFAVSRTGNLTTMFVDGISRATTNAAYTISSVGTIVSIGAESSTPIYFFKGYISNLRAVKGVGLYTANFTPSATPLTAITNTSLLTCQSARFIDNSAAPATITVAGTPKVVSSNPFNLPSGLSAYGAGYFNGSSYLSTPSNAALAVGTGDFTLECWIYALSASDNGIFENRSVGSNDGFTLTAFSSSVIRIYTNSAIIASSGTVYLNIWTHIAVARYSGTTTLYINGVSVGTSVSMSNCTNSDAIIAGGRYAGTSSVNSYFPGYISNLRMVKGTAVYTTNFTPPTAPLTAITNTSLLTLQTNVPHNNSQFRDTSTNNALITRNGNTTQGSFSPFTKQYPYLTATVGGSAYFDGTGDHLTVPFTAGGPLDFGAGNFTIEYWINTTVNGNTTGIGYFNSGQDYGYAWILTVDTSNIRMQISSAAVTTSLDYSTSGVTITDGTWHHIALVRSGNTFTTYVDGIARGTGSSSITLYAPSQPLRIGMSNTYPGYFTGYVSNYRIVKGTALYTSNFTPSTAPLTAVSGTVLLMPFTNAAVYDNTMLSNLETVGNVQVNTSVFKYGTGSLKFNGSTDYLSIPAKPTLAFGAGDFTVEGWVYANALGSYNAVIAQWPAGNGDATNSYVLESVGSSMNFYWVSGVTLYGPATLGTITTGVWIHYAICRSGNTLYPFKNGVLGTTVSITQTLNSPASAITVGGSVAGAGYWDGYIDELRITKGYARYTAAFTPSTGAFSASAPFGTSVLPSKSLRFRKSASAYLSKTFAVAGNRTTWTWSGWVKRGILGATSLTLFGAGPSSNTDFFYFGFEYSGAADKLVILDYPGASSLDLRTTQVFRDPAAWYHIVLSVDTTQAASTNRVKLYVNGVQITSFSTATYPSQNSSTRVNSADVHNIGSDRFAASPNYTFDGEMAEVNFVDGLALDPTMFGAYSAYNQWLPVSYSGYMGANGFYLPFNAATATTSANYLVVAGGGGGGTYGGGGGGGGGFRTATGVTLDPTTVYAVTVGAGGTGPSALNVRGGLGGDSSFNALTSTGGGGGGTDNLNAGTAGGSGGGAALSYNTTYAGGAASPVTSPVQGYAGAGTTASGGSFYNASGGGGGASAAGTTGSIVAAGGGYGNGGYGTSGNGGAGAVSSISGTSVTYAGGGGGGGASTGAAYPNSYYVTAGTGGAGGGGNGTMVNSRGIAGTTNLGGGGGGGGMYAGGITGGGAGGSGVVIISYSGTQKFYGGNVTSVGGNTIHTFTTSGSLTGVFGDQSGNNNNWTPNNINVSTVGPTYDLLTDVPTLTSATAANYCVINTLTARGSAASTNGNLTYTAAAANDSSIFMTMAVPSNNLIYFELFYSIDLGLGNNSYVGVSSVGDTGALITTGTNLWSYNLYSGVAYNQSSTTTYTAVTNGQTAQYAFDIANGKIWVGANGTWFNSGNPVAGTGAVLTSVPLTATNIFASLNGGGSNRSKIDFNFGQRPFVYTPPANFLALNTFNI